jgi:hypothetical protein
VKVGRLASEVARRREKPLGVTEVSVRHLLEAICDRMTAVAGGQVPIWVEADRVLRIGRRGVSFEREFEFPRVVMSEDALDLAVSALDTLQQEIIEVVRSEWPTGKPHKPWQNLHRPGGRLEGDSLELWYGNADDPALRLPPIPLEDLGAHH